LPAPLVEVQDLSKAFAGARALDGVTLDIAAGEVHALCGENGAGKSTLIKALAGSHRPDGGAVRVDGRPLPPGDVRASEAAGIAVIYQESVAFPHLSAAENVFVGREPRRLGGLLLDRRGMRRDARALLLRLGEPGIDVDVPVARLTPAQRQMVGIARALSHRCRLLIMDEPTASLSARETEVLFRIIRQLRADGVSVLYVSHRMEEIFDLADRVTVLRDGRHVATRPIAEVTTAELIRLMVGREVDLLRREHAESTEDAAQSPAPVLLDVRGLTRAGSFEDVSLAVRAGEVVGLAGLVGAGRSEVVQAVFGADGYDAGTVEVCGSPLPPRSVRAAVRRGLALVPEDRQHLGLVLPMSVAANLTMCVSRALARWGLRRGRAERALVGRLMHDLQVRAPGPGVPAEALSGGNQQKLVLGKWLATRPRVLMLDEPTRGVDVGAKAEIHRLIRELTRGGMATLVISSELPEVLALCDRIVVMREGRIAGELRGDGATQEQVLALALPDAGAVEMGAGPTAVATPQGVA
jgi:ABC-type sugar transport system ATPase subunit